MRKYLLLISSLLGISFLLLAQSATPMGDNESIIVPSWHQTLDCEPNTSVHLALQGLILEANSGSVLDTFTLSAERLPYTEAVSPMPSGMENVTTGRAVYRLLPHGEHFAEPARLTMDYDPDLLPHDYRPKDIYTFYYDSLNSRWMQLMRIDVDTIEHTIVSLTTHFTDFANAIIKVPEMPRQRLLYRQ